MFWEDVFIGLLIGFFAREIIHWARTKIAVRRILRQQTRPYLGERLLQNAKPES